MATEFMVSMLYKFIDLSDNRLRAFYMEYIMKPDNEIGNPVPVKQAEGFFTRHVVQDLVCLNTDY
jgi:hypothetical protein